MGQLYRRNSNSCFIGKRDKNDYKLLRIIKFYSFLYNILLEDYGDVQKRHKAWIKIGKEHGRFSARTCLNRFVELIVEYKTSKRMVTRHDNILFLLEQILFDGDVNRIESVLEVDSLLFPPFANSSDQTPPSNVLIQDLDGMSNEIEEFYVHLEKYITEQINDRPYLTVVINAFSQGIGIDVANEIKITIVKKLVEIHKQLNAG